MLAFLRDACSWASDARFCLPFLCLTDSHVSVGPQYRPVAAIAVSGLLTLLQPIKTDPSYQSLLLLGEIGECAHSRKLSAVNDASLLSAVGFYGCEYSHEFQTSHTNYDISSLHLQSVSVESLPGGKHKLTSPPQF